MTARSTRRSFMQTAGAALSVPLAAVAASTPAGAATPPAAGDSPEARLAYLEDVHAIRALNQEFARGVNARSREKVSALFANPADAHVEAEVRAISTDGFGEHDAVTIALDRQAATALLPCTVQAETAIGPDCPLVEMARLQGGGMERRTERGQFDIAYVRREGVWKIQRVAYRPA